MRTLALALVAACYAAPQPAPQSWRAPITVYAEPDYAETYDRSLDVAIDLWNDAADCILFARTPQRSRADVIVRIGPREHGVAGRAHADSPSVVEYKYPADARHAAIVAAHELGHLLGVPHHDRLPASVMYPWVTSDYDRQIRDDDAPDRSIVLVPRSTGAAVRRLYCEP